MPPRYGLIAGATEAVEGVVRVGVDWGGRAKHDADRGEESLEWPEALAPGVRRAHKHPSTKCISGQAARTIRCVSARGIMAASPLDAYRTMTDSCIKRMLPLWGIKVDARRRGAASQ